MKFQICSPTLPLAVYLEMAAHLQQLEGVETGLIPQQAQEFSYNQSQVGGLWIHYPENFNATSQARLQQILSYYRDRYGSWQELPMQA